MDVFTGADRARVWHTMARRLQDGAVAILPTDTIYGLTGDARSAAVVQRVADIKRRSRPPTIIPHDLAWARALVHDEALARFDDLQARYRGAYTLLLPVSDHGRAALPPAVTETGLIGMRWPAHWITKLAEDAQVPFMSTSANVTTRPFMTSLDDLDPAVSAHVDFVFYEGPRPVRPSTLIWADQDPPRIEAR